MAERFVTDAGTISVTNGASTVVGVGTLFGGRDRAGAKVIAYPAASAPIHVGTVAEVDPRGIYEHLELPLVHPFRGSTLTDVEYELVDGPAIANGTTQAAIFARFAAFLEQNMGLVGNTADDIDYSLVPNNSLFVDAVTRVIYQWRNGVLDAVHVIAFPFIPRGRWEGLGSPTEIYALNDLVQHGNYVFISNIAGNVDHEPITSPSPDSNQYWTWLPLPEGPGDIFALSIAINGRPLGGELVEGHVFADTIEFADDFAGSYAVARVAPTAEAVFSILKNGVEVGTVTFAAASTAGVFASSGAVICTAGQSIDVECPDPQDSTISGVKITIRGTR